MSDRLMVIVPDRLSQIIGKGEVTPRYYNPGDLFRRVDLVLTNDDRPDPAAVQPMVGGAELHLHNLPAGQKLFVRTLGWRPMLLGSWAAQAVELARAIRPQLVRCHGAQLNGFAARTIRRQLGIPYVMSLHTHPEEDVRRRWTGLKDWVLGHAMASVERQGLLGADLVLPVYRSLVPFLEGLGVTRLHVAYNVLNGAAIAEKSSYEIGQRLRIVSTGRQIPGKDPANLIRAVARIAEAELMLVGDGVLHARLKALAQELGAADRIRFVPAAVNAELCANLRDYDVFAVQVDYLGIPKTVMEAMLAGLPVVVNRRHGIAVPELNAEACLLVEDAAEDYERALRALIADGNFRARLGRAGRAQARRLWEPADAEAAVVRHYRDLLGLAAPKEMAAAALPTRS
jgi:glycosyltransferase involved in cell wall biosynthesis